MSNVGSHHLQLEGQSLHDSLDAPSVTFTVARVGLIVPRIREMGGVPFFGFPCSIQPTIKGLSMMGFGGRYKGYILPCKLVVV